MGLTKYNIIEKHINLNNQNWVKWANLGIFCHFLLGDVEKCELTTNYVMMVSKNMKTSAIFYGVKL